MDEILLKKQLAKLRAFADNLPKGRVEEKYVTIYHELLSGIGQQIGHDFGEFYIPSGELRHHNAGGYTDDFGRFVTKQSSHAYCDAEMFQIHMNGALNFI